jgi:hypothetical protein
MFKIACSRAYVCTVYFKLERVLSWVSKLQFVGAELMCRENILLSEVLWPICYKNTGDEGKRGCTAQERFRFLCVNLVHF